MLVKLNGGFVTIRQNDIKFFGKDKAMNQKDLEYLRKMEGEARQRAFSKEEIEHISEALRTNVDIADSTEALDLVREIMDKQSFNNNVELFHGLADEVIYHGELLGANLAVLSAKTMEMNIAAKFIDEGRYDEFQEMRDKGFDSLDEENYFHQPLIYCVRTLKGAEYLDQKGLIPEGYFTANTHDDPILLGASSEQIDFYIAHGADVNAENYNGDRVLNLMLYDSYPIEMVKKVYQAGGYFDEYFDSGRKVFDNCLIWKPIELNAKGDKAGAKNSLDAIAFLIKENLVSTEKLDLLLSSPDLFEKYPETMKELFADDKHLEEKLAKVVERRELEKQPDDLLEEKQDKINKAVRRLRGMIRPRRSFPDDDPRKEYWELKEKIKVGKTADVKTGEVRKEHKSAAQIQTEAAKRFMLEHRKQKGD